jgi:CubicO group peptidase (beta-lactamase class C family)
MPTAPTRNRLAVSAIAAAVAAGLVGSLIVAASPGVATTPPSGHVSKRPITLAQLRSGAQPKGLTRNVRFARPRDATAAPALKGTLHLKGATMGLISDADNRRISNPVGGKDTTFFPNVDLAFFTDRGHLVPVTQNVIRNGVLAGTKSYWDVIVQPGRTWTQPGDHGWHRASFPFALVNSIEGETHNGVAMFAYRGRQVSAVRFQIVQMTAPYDVPEYFSAWGASPASFTPGVAHLAKLRKQHRKAEAAQLPVRPLSALRKSAAPAAVKAFNSYSDVVGAAVVVHGVLYRDNCPTSAGPFPYCDSARWGVWSVTKSAMLNVAMMRLAQKYGRKIVRAPISRFLPAARTPGWKDVTFGDLANMASGHGPAKHPHCYLCDYVRWYLAPSERQKTVEALDYRRFAKPGTVYNYRDQDAYLLGVAEEALLRKKAGKDASILAMLRKEVYRPIGVYSAPTNTTVEPGANGPRAQGHMMGAYGFYPTFDDLAKIAALYENHGRAKGRQILDRSLTTRLLSRPHPAPAALPGSKNGSHWYLTDWHIQRVRSSDGCTRFVPQMDGWGGNTVTALPGRVTLIRIRNNWVGDPSNAQTSINRLADRLSPLCGRSS